MSRILPAEFEDKAAAKAALLEDVSELAEMQDVFWASKQYALIIILQALDAAGKDSTIKHVMSGVNPQGVAVYSFKAPTEEERLHHFLWRPMRVLPGRGNDRDFQPLVLRGSAGGAGSSGVS